MFIFRKRLKLIRVDNDTSDLTNDKLALIKQKYANDILKDSKCNEVILLAGLSIDLAMLIEWTHSNDETTFLVTLRPKTRNLIFRTLDQKSKADQKILTDSISRRSVIGLEQDQTEPGRYITGLTNLSYEQKKCVTRLTNDVLKTLNVKEPPTFESTKLHLTCNYVIHNSILLSDELNSLCAKWRDIVDLQIKPCVNDKLLVVIKLVA
jgi:hypothetical protein